MKMMIIAMAVEWKEMKMVVANLTRTSRLKMTMLKAVVMIMMILPMIVVIAAMIAIMKVGDCSEDGPVPLIMIAMTVKINADDCDDDSEDYDNVDIDL